MIIHQTLANGRWFEKSLIEQLANVGCDFDRAIRWRNKGDLETSQKALDRGLELLLFTIADPKNKKRLRELTRIKECFLDYFLGANQYSFTDESWHAYFFNYNYMYALQKGK